jgi:hypothetical protein
VTGERRVCLPHARSGLPTLLGCWLAARLFPIVTRHGFFNLSWLTAIVCAAILLLACHLITSWTGRTAHLGMGRLSPPAGGR